MAAARAFTARSVDSEKAADARREIGDPGCPGLLLIVQPNGKKSWAYRGRHAVTKRPVKKTFGSYPAHSLAEAREWAIGHRQARERGVDLDDDRQAKAVEETRQRDLLEERQTKTLNWFWDTYYDPRYVERLRDKRETRRLYDSHLRASLGSTCIFDIEHDDLAAIVEDVFGRAPAVSNRLLSLTKTMFKRAARELRAVTGLKVSPAEYLPRLHTQATRERVLDDRELAYFLQAIDSLAGAKSYVRTYTSITRLVLDTGVRISEAREAVWSEFDLDERTWLIPSERTKNHRPFLLTLPESVIYRLKVAKSAAKSPWVFPSSLEPRRCFNSVSKAQEVLWLRTRHIAAADGYALERWSAHDLRRSFRTGLRAIGHRQRLNHVLTTDLLEALLNHVSGASKAGVAGVYDRYEYAEQKREALQIWSTHIAKLAPREPSESGTKHTMQDGK
ncbi:tyrosine-type recombinase/integrase [Sphingomonas sp. BIUV-7]|uniref:Tyrosine-type recombinase/integrase n=1 Tax=Sphingomonas natans TaxID=3063330 RepID=A0ABT8Y768_9SPHN|nr:site-specific integrase [Sphingomonas sp. BIUV-7]MDO6413579.1 tyrosine-type recombinase/integrase [Sphingomonas sp. BIUV-7]